ncbi:MAG TPA: hypothetical protein PLX89_07290 [Verrucomicrobiota bacterium]|nr:hypothetical protein [Verrucomicrobiota bacterium]
MPTDVKLPTVDNCRILHRLSPVLHAKGSHLVAREMVEEKDQRIREAAQIRAAKEEALSREFFHIEKSPGNREKDSRQRVTLC